MAALRLVYRSPWNVLLALAACAVMAVFDLWSSQVLVVSGHGVSFLRQTQFVAAALIMALLFGLVVPLLVYATRLALADASQAGGTALGAIFGTVSMTCCAPVILPAILSLVGFSGTTILHVNQTLNRFWMPLAVAGIILWPVGVSGFDSGRHVVGRVDLEPLVREATRQQHEFIVVVHQEDADPSGSTPLAFIASRGDER